ncbi:CPK17 [Symbiodinium sp. KB8]|nr:CPK17 [Symbiodinium sp. KB8]
MGNQGSRDPATGEVESPSEAEEAAILADPSLTDAQKAERMHVLEPKDRGRRLEDHFRPLDGGILGKGEHWSVLVLAVPRTCPAEQMPGLPVPPRVLRVRSAGHYGEVCLVERISDGQRFALKTIVKRKPIYVEILKNEVQILSNTDHPGIVQMVDKFERMSQLFLVFELCHGGELFEPIADSSVTLSERQSARIVRASFVTNAWVLEAVRYLHDIGVIHRDLKPENILLKERGIDSEIKVIDFGLATYMKPGEMLRRHVGTPYYIAPEVLEKNYSKEADVWSLGVILYTLLCSAPPFFGDTEREIYRRIRTGEVMFDGPDWEPRSIACRDLVVSLLKKTPHVRLSLDGALTHRWVVYEGDVATDPRDHRTFARLFARLRRYGVFPILKKLVMLHIAHKIIADESRSDRERRFFSIIDGDSDGFISSLDLATFLNGQDADLRIEEVDWIVEGLSMREGEDRDASLAEFSAAVMPRLNYLRESSLIHEFSFFDRDSNGIIDVSDLVAAAGIDKETADIAIAEADLGQGEGGVDFGTFVRLMAGGERDAI